MKKRLKTEAVRSRVYGEILRGQYAPGDRLPTEREMERLGGASRIIVRQAYAELEQAGVIERVHGVGTFVAKTAAGNARNQDSIALLTGLHDLFSVEFVETVEAAVADAHALLVLKLTAEDRAKEEQAAISLVAHGVRNLIVWPSGRTMAAGTFERLRVLGVNLVFFDRVVPGAYADYVGVDNAHAIETIMRHARRRGATRFAFVNHAGDFADTDRARQEHFEKWVAREGAEHEIVTVPRRGDYAGAVSRHLNRWAKLGQTLAVVCVNDDVACALKRAAGDRLTIYGIDGLPLAKQLGVTSYAQPMRQMAAEAVRMLRRQQSLGAAWTASRRYCRGKLIPGDT
ncbi:MAG: GntR family transcriptional regulator [Lentisphaeria bacterium]